MGTRRVRPVDEGELAEAIRGATGPVSIRGGGTRAPVIADAMVLETGGLSGIRLYEPGALTMVAGAGTPLAQIEAALAAEGQRLAFEPMDHRGLMGTAGEPTIGGAVAGNVSGPRRIQAGACRDFLLGVRFVDGLGRVVANGGRVMKNVTGYDLVKLMAGSQGTLGVISEVAFKVLPAPESAATLIIEDLDDARAVAALTRALGSPFEVTGAAHLPGQPARTLIRIEGFEGSVGYRAGRLAALLAEFGAARVERDAARVAALWRAVRDAEPLHGQAGDVWRISVKPSDGPEAARRIGAEAVLYDWGGGLVWALVAEGSDIRPRLAGLPGHATLVRAGPETRARLPACHPEPPALAALSRGLRARFDPRGILNPGRMG